MVFGEEPGDDTGGLTLEFFRLVLYAMSAKYMTSSGCFSRNALAFQVRALC